MTIIMLLLGLGLIVLGANSLVEGASGIARRAGVSEFAIGLTIVGFGTSCPELVVSLTGAIQGNADIAVGNVIGSNIFNTLFILGLTSLLYPVAMTDANRKSDIPIALIATVMLLVFGMCPLFAGNGGSISRIEGLLFMAAFAFYVFFAFRTSGKDTGPESPRAVRPVPASILMAILGLAGLVGGGELFVRSATRLAGQMGVSDKFIAVTVLAGGTSLPELATSLVAALKGRPQLALGNILGSNVFNILFILGSSALIMPLSFASVTIVDAAVLLLSSVLLVLCAYTGRKLRIDRFEGAAMLAVFAAYYIYLFNKL